MQPIKKYTIHILAITAFNPKHFEIPFDLPDERNAVIICTGRENRFLKEYKGNKLEVGFLDVEDQDYAFEQHLVKLARMSWKIYQFASG